MSTVENRPFRMIGPFHNRTITAIEDHRLPGQVSHETAALLLKTGWKRYTGPATAVDGWIVKDSDPALHPRRVQIS
jgi:hypothetical protein